MSTAKRKINKPVLRDAETKDMKSIIYLTERLIEHEMRLSRIPIIEDMQERKRIVMETIARALVDTEQHVWVVEKVPGRIVGVFIVGKEYQFTIESRNPVCNFYHAYSQKTVLSFYEIHNRVKEWARAKSCKAIKIIELIGNIRTQKLIELLGYTNTAMVWEMDI